MGIEDSVRLTIRQVRDWTGETVGQLASGMGLERTQLSRKLSGNGRGSTITLEDLDAVCAHWGLTGAELMGGFALLQQHGRLPARAKRDTACGQQVLPAPSAPAAPEQVTDLQVAKALSGWTRPNNTNVSRVLKAAGHTPSDGHQRLARHAGYRAQQDGDQVLVTFRGGGNTDDMTEEHFLQLRDDMAQTYGEVLRAAGYTVAIERSTVRVLAGKRKP